FQNRALIAVSQGGAYAARWYDANLKPAAAPFTLPGSGGSKPVVRPRVGGGHAEWRGVGRTCAAVAGVAPELRPPVHPAGASVRADPAQRRPRARHARSLLRRRRALRVGQVPCRRALDGPGRDGDRKLRRRGLHARLLERPFALSAVTTPCTSSPAPSAAPPCRRRRAGTRAGSRRCR